MTLAIYAREVTARVFALSGGEVYFYRIGDDPSDVIELLLPRQEIQLILIEDTILANNADYFHKVCMSNDQPLLVGIPSITATEPEPSLVVLMVNRALGLTTEGGLS